MIVILVPIFLMAVIAGLTVLYLTWHFNHWKMKGICGPKPSIVFGTWPGLVDGKIPLFYEVQKTFM